MSGHSSRPSSPSLFFEASVISIRAWFEFQSSVPTGDRPVGPGRHQTDIAEHLIECCPNRRGDPLRLLGLGVVLDPRKVGARQARRDLETVSIECETRPPRLDHTRAYGCAIATPTNPT